MCCIRFIIGCFGLGKQLQAASHRGKIATRLPRKGVLLAAYSLKLEAASVNNLQLKTH